MKLAGKCAIVTGSSQGFGLAAARAFVEAGAHVAMYARGEEMLRIAQENLIRSVAGKVKVIAMASEFGEIMHEHWEYKERRSSGMSNPRINEWYENARANGAIGGKLVGAGGGGFLMFYTEDRRKLRRAMAHSGLEEVRFRFYFEGTKILMS